MNLAVNFLRKRLLVDGTVAHLRELVGQVLNAIEASGEGGIMTGVCHCAIVRTARRAVTDNNG